LLEALCARKVVLQVQTQIRFKYKHTGKENLIVQKEKLKEKRKKERKKKANKKGVRVQKRRSKCYLT